MSFADRFTGRAGDYAAGRPSYPAEAIDVLLAGLGDPAEIVVADLGAGTGISSRLLAERGAHVLAIEPNRAMREAAEPHPNVEWVDASAEQTGLPEAGVDLVTAFQAFHWFEQRAALDEIVRILRPGGRAAVIYNERDERDPFTAAYGELVRKYQADETERGRADGLETFAAFELWKERRRVEIGNERVLDADAVLALARSTSYLPKEGDRARELHDEIRALVGRFARDGRVAMMLRTIVVACEAGTAGG